MLLQSQQANLTSFQSYDESFLPTLLVATTSAPVSRIFFTITLPISTGAKTSMPFKIEIASKIFSLGIGMLVQTGTKSISPFLTWTVVVRILLGFVNSSFAHFIPLLHPNPVNSKVSPCAFFSIVQPLGQRMHVTLFFCILASSLLFLPLNVLQAYHNIIRKIQLRENLL